MTRWTLAAVQAEPVILDRKGSLAKAVDLIARTEADLMVFPETFVPGYAHWAHSARFEHPDHQAAYARLAKASVRVPEDLDVIAEAAAASRTTVVMPVTERTHRQPGTLHNTMAVFGPDGAYLGKHRKLVPTHHERTIYAYGAGDTMRAFEVDGVRLGGLLCWNNYMPLARAALYQQGIGIYVAPTADDLPSWQDAMRFIARESRCFVVSSCIIQRKSAFPSDWELADDPIWQEEGEWNERGGSVIVGPDGEVLAGPVYEEETVLTAQVDLDDVIAKRQGFDPTGHYGRPEVLDLVVRGLDDAGP